MPISPIDAKKNFEESDRIALEELQKYVDSYLMKNYHTGPSIRISYSISNVNKRVQDKFKEAYKKAGWKQVAFSADYNNGSYVELNENEALSGNYWQDR